MNLSQITDRFVSELDEIESIFAMCKGHPTVAGYKIPYAPTEDGCLVSIWDSWTRFLRELVVASASSSVIGLSGVTYPIAIPRNESEILLYLQANNLDNRFGFVNGEPNWNNEKKLATIADYLGIVNGNQIVGAISATSISLYPVTVDNPLAEIRQCRNFVAHKTDPNLIEVSKYAKPPFVDLSTHMRGSQRGVETFSEWKECLVTLAEAAAQ